MAINTAIIEKLDQECQAFQTKWIAVTKKRNPETIKKLYDLGIRNFGENKAQEFIDKYDTIPYDAIWHFIGHLQTNKVRAIIDKVSFIHSVDSFKLFKTIQKEAAKKDKMISIFIQLHLAEEDSKYGFTEAEAKDFFKNIELNDYPNINISGLMTMATNTNNEEQISKEFKQLRSIRDQINTEFNLNLKGLSMGMSNDYKIALKSGSTLLRIGSILYK